jgi:uroporphyrin-III C-methyltransferase/precorrin-2 dehydrogenase/sirohydrochlorin ferrochelatase/uroporphyrin-III C-methyltransferase
MDYSKTIMKEIQKGKVIIAGAGPGDPELVTLKTIRYLKQADVILTDRLVSSVLLDEYANPNAEIIYVGKQCRRGASTPQSTINQLLVHHAFAGSLVLRLKGGDVSIFSNILDELQILRELEIPYEIVPGISAALGAAAYSAIPLTARGFSTAVRFLTFYKSDVLTAEYWNELAHTTDTLVFYMSSETIDGVVSNLLAHAISSEKMLAVIEQATTPYQRVHVASFTEFESKLKGKKFTSPSLIIIGRVVRLHEEFSWLTNSEVNESYFEQVSASVKNLITTQQESVYAGRA